MSKEKEEKDEIQDAPGLRLEVRDRSFSNVVGPVVDIENFLLCGRRSGRRRITVTAGGKEAHRGG